MAKNDFRVTSIFKIFDLLSTVDKLIPLFTLFTSCILTPKKPFLRFVSLCSLFNSANLSQSVLFIAIVFPSQNCKNSEAN